MAFYPDVKPGDTFTPNAFLSNDVRHFFNQLNGFRDDQVSGNHNVVVVQVYNESKTDTLKGGIPVNFGTAPMIENAIPIVPYTKSDESWGVIPQAIRPREIGSCIVSGPVKVTISGSFGKYAVPTQDGFRRQDSADGNAAQLLYSNGSTGVICLGAGNSANKAVGVTLATLTSSGNYTSTYKASYKNEKGETVDTLLRCVSLGLGEGLSLPAGATVIGYQVETTKLDLEEI